MDDYCFKNCFENFISDIINDYFLNSYYIRGDLLDVDSIYEYSLSQKYLDEVKLELYSYKDKAVYFKPILYETKDIGIKSLTFQYYQNKLIIWINCSTEFLLFENIINSIHNIDRLMMDLEKNKIQSVCYKIKKEFKIDIKFGVNVIDYADYHKNKVKISDIVWINNLIYFNISMMAFKNIKYIEKSMSNFKFDFDMINNFIENDVKIGYIQNIYISDEYLLQLFNIYDIPSFYRITLFIKYIYTTPSNEYDFFNQYQNGKSVDLVSYAKLISNILNIFTFNKFNLALGYSFSYIDLKSQLSLVNERGKYYGI